MLTITNRGDSMTVFTVFMGVNELTEAIIGAAINVHKTLGPGLLESTYERCLGYELTKIGLKVRHQEPIAIQYEEMRIECGFKSDLLVDDRVFVECKAKDKIHPVDRAQTLTHLRLLKLQVGLLINFNVVKLVTGVHRIVNNFRPDDPNPAWHPGGPQLGPLHEPASGLACLPGNAPEVLRVS